MRRAGLLASVLVLASPALAVAPAATTQAPSEYAVKAAFLYNFAKFVDWPATAAAPADDRFVITILGEDPFGPAIDDTLRGKPVGSRRVVVRRVSRAADMGTTRILFISDSEAEDLPQILERLEGDAVLTVGEMDGFAERGGVIRFRVDKGRIRLDINRTIAERAGLKISSDLLKLARIVEADAAP